MILIINVKNKIVKLLLKENKNIIDGSEFIEGYNLSEKLLPAIDRLLKKNKLAPEDVKKVTVQTDTPGSFTTSRIAKAVGKAWNFAVPVLNK